MTHEEDLICPLDIFITSLSTTTRSETGIVPSENKETRSKLYSLPMINHKNVNSVSIVNHIISNHKGYSVS